MNKKLFSISVDEENFIRKKIASLTLAEKVGQLFMPGLLGNYLSEDSDEFERIKILVTKYKVGGFVMFSGRVNDYISNINRFQAMSEIPLLISADFERGVAMRIPEATPFPHAMGLAATNDLQMIQTSAEIISKETRALGAHQNYAPVADLSSNYLNPIVNTRAFSDDAGTAAKFASAFIKGMKKQKVISTAKHFPGHGNTEIDSHRDLPTILSSKKEMYERELAPFKKLIEAGVQSVMIGHLSVPAFESRENLPAVLSKKIITDLLKDELGFAGLIVTDALNMQAVCNYFSVAQSAVDAFKAGNDLLLFSADDEIAIEAVIDAVKRKEISEARLNESVEKILRAKAWLGLFGNHYAALDFESAAKVIASRANLDFAYMCAEKSIALVKDENKFFPLREANDLSCITLSDAAAGETELFFQKYLDQKIFLKRKICLSANSSDAEIADALNISDNSGVLLIPAFVRIRAYQGFSALPPKLNYFLRRIIENKKNYAVISFGNPYLLSLFPGIQTYVAAFGDSHIVQKSCADVILKCKEFLGRLPTIITNIDRKIF